MTDWERAQTLMRTDSFTCVLVRDDTVYASTARGIRPMVAFLSEGIDLSGCSVSDKVVGKAPALLFVLAGVIEVYAPVMSEGALQVLQAHGIPAHYKTLVPAVRNRQGTGLCPMELAVRDISDPARALEAVRETLRMLSA